MINATHGPPGSIVRVEEHKRDVPRAPASIFQRQRFATRKGKVSNERVVCSVYRHRVQVIVFPAKCCSYHPSLLRVEVAVAFSRGELC